ncbi:transporter, major facilitator family protein [Dictyocaulus viviparus]|uniref:Transporter, major facilitator family protein n=1 Tax=Dictyocaulus viviparus TaxID=29172 RepID=A0A0D8XXX2_DICVI|nr:transporter, major facilitator family protein [Dictyocaulus viviparus]
MKFDEFLFSYLGEMGKYQKLQFLLVCFPTIIVSMHALSWSLAAAPVPFRCALPFETPESPYLSNDTSLSIRECRYWNDLPVSENESGTYGVHCFYNEECELDGEQCVMHVYDRSRIRYSAVDRWDISCSRGWIRATVQAFYYIGQMIGSMVFGVLGDRIGRKKVFFIAILLQITCGLGSVVAPTWSSFAVLRAGLGFSHPGIFVIAVVIGMELVGPQYRKLASVITGGFFAVGQILLGFEGYLITDYRYLQLAIVSPAFLFLSYWWLVPESARWLVSQRKFEEANKVLQRAAKVNNVSLPEKWWEQLDIDSDSSERKSVKKYKLWDLFKTPVLRKRTLVTFFLWPVVSMVYYGMAMKPNALGGDIYINFVFSATVEIPALILVLLIIDKVGRRLVLSGGYFLAGGCLLMNYFMGDNATLVVSIIQMMITKGAITGVYASIYTYSPELFPTVIRNTAMGCCSTIARLGAISASYISLWIVESFGKVYMIVPFAILAILAGLLTLVFLPETMGKSLPETIAQVENADKPEPQEMQLLAKKELDEASNQHESTNEALKSV